MNRPYYFGEYGPVWAAGPTAARKRLESFPRNATGSPVAVDPATVPDYLHLALLGLGRPAFGAPAGKYRETGRYVTGWVAEQGWSIYGPTGSPGNIVTGRTA